MSYGADDATLLDTLIDLAATIWDEYGDEITEWVWKKGVPWTIDKVKSILKAKEEKARSGMSETDKLTGGTLSQLAWVLEESRTRNLGKARQGILNALKLREQAATTTVKGANKTGQKFTVSNVFSKQGTSGSSDWMESVGALVLGAAVGGVGLWAYKKYWRR